MLLFSLEHHLFTARKNLIEQSQFFAPANRSSQSYPNIKNVKLQKKIANAIEMPDDCVVGNTFCRLHQT